MLEAGALRTPPLPKTLCTRSCGPRQHCGLKAYPCLRFSSAGSWSVAHTTPTKNVVYAQLWTQTVLRPQGLVHRCSKVLVLQDCQEEGSSCCLCAATCMITGGRSACVCLSLFGVFFSCSCCLCAETRMTAGRCRRLCLCVSCLFALKCVCVCVCVQSKALCCKTASACKFCMFSTPARV